MKVISKKIINEKLKVYDIAVDDARHYFLDNNVISHNTMEIYSKAQVSGGTGIQYASDVILVLSKAKQKDGTEHVGANITCTVDKSRYIPEGNKIKVQILFKKGISKYSSLVDLAYEYNIFKKEGISFLLPDGEKVKMKEVRNNPEKYITPFIDEIGKEIKKRFSFDSEEAECNDKYSDNEEIENGDVEGEEVDQLEEIKYSPQVLNEG